MAASRPKRLPPNIGRERGRARLVVVRFGHTRPVPSLCRPGQVCGRATIHGARARASARSAAISRGRRAPSAPRGSSRRACGRGFLRSRAPCAGSRRAPSRRASPPCRSRAAEGSRARGESLPPPSPSSTGRYSHRHSVRNRWTRSRSRSPNSGPPHARLKTRARSSQDFVPKPPSTRRTETSASSTRAGRCTSTHSAELHHPALDIMSRRATVATGALRGISSPIIGSSSASWRETWR